MPGVDKLFVAEGRTVGMRGQCAGTLMFDTIFQSRGVWSAAADASKGSAPGAAGNAPRRGLVRLEIPVREVSSF